MSRPGIGPPGGPAREASTLEKSHLDTYLLANRNHYLGWGETSNLYNTNKNFLLDSC
jgi:hypothetical protein